MLSVEIYADGACINTTKIGGWAYRIMYSGKLVIKRSGHTENVTNNIMEMAAVLEGLKKYETLEGEYRSCPLYVYTDSAYVANAFNEGWIQKWKDNGWINSQKMPVKNKDIWEELDIIMHRNGALIKRTPRNDKNIMLVDIRAREVAKKRNLEIQT